MQIFYLILLGMVAGLTSGFVGIGGGVILVPALVLFFGLTQHQAQGTTLALLVPPIGIFAAWAYWKNGYVDLRIATIIGVGFLVGSYLGARYATALPNNALERLFGIFLLILGLRLLLANHS